MAKEHFKRRQLRKNLLRYPRAVTGAPQQVLRGCVIFLSAQNLLRYPCAVHGGTLTSFAQIARGYLSKFCAI